MIDVAREVARVRGPVLAVSALAWVLLAIGPGLHGPALELYCPAPGGGSEAVAASLSVMLALNPPSALAAGWALMLTAMMLPLIVPEIHHVRFTGLVRRRARSTALFVAGYGGVWMLGGVGLIGAALVARAAMPGSYGPFAALAAAACLWQASPLKQTCLNRCQDTPPLRAFGAWADLDAFRFGCQQGLWCAASCSPLMLCALLLPSGHLAGMLTVAVLIYSERLDDPEPPRWAIRGPRKVVRMAMARIRLLRAGAPQDRASCRTVEAKISPCAGTLFRRSNSFLRVGFMSA